ncbi:hypothetical protein SCOCK_230028 [Actinacidiphila cocklensis]|uniref:Uncharacterized protein n=1 Tax=Actinacidiphila cocklensis TaxID=887465 RepID=A0A9W4DTY6_9ACTN|nr:hypothetical protein SCOCK_230028 [Actinacidiphila cocklensis]
MRLRERVHLPGQPPDPSLNLGFSHGGMLPASSVRGSNPRGHPQVKLGGRNCATSRRRAARRHRPKGGCSVRSGPPAGGRLSAGLLAPLKSTARRSGHP